jgi:hypothetical protein
MSEIPFHRTPMGRTYYDHTLPSLVRELQRLNTNLERLVTNVTREAASPAQPGAVTDGESPDESPK